MTKTLRCFSLRSAAVMLAGVTVFSAVLAPSGLAEGTATKPVVDAEGQAIARKVQEIILSRVSSPNNSLKVTVVPTAQAARGYFSQISIVGAPVNIKKMRVTEFNLQARNVRLSVAQLQSGNITTLQTQTTLRAVVTEDDLAQMLAVGKTTRSMGLKVKYLKDPKQGDLLRVTGNWKWNWFNGPVDGVGKLRVTANNQVYADIISLKLNGAEVPAFVKEKFSEKLNPVLDYNDVPFQPHFKSVKVEGNRAILSA